MTKILIIDSNGRRIPEPRLGALMARLISWEKVTDIVKRELKGDFGYVEVTDDGLRVVLDKIDARRSP